MIDIKFLRENPDVVKQNIKNKFQDHKLPLVDEVIELDKQSREVKAQADGLRTERNKISKQIGMLMAQGKGRGRANQEKGCGICGQACRARSTGRAAHLKSNRNNDENTEHYRPVGTDRQG